jgi:hypothetical protein
LVTRCDLQNRKPFSIPVIPERLSFFIPLGISDLRRIVPFDSELTPKNLFRKDTAYAGNLIISKAKTSIGCRFWKIVDCSFATDRSLKTMLYGVGTS